MLVQTLSHENEFDLYEMSGENIFARSLVLTQRQKASISCLRDIIWKMKVSVDRHVVGSIPLKKNNSFALISNCYNFHKIILNVTHHI